MKNNLIQELSQRKKTDRYLSFGTYIVVILILIGLLIFASFLVGMQWRWHFLRGRWYFDYRPHLPFEFFLYLGGWILTIMAIFLALSIIFWWYQWQLYRRRNEHIERAKSLRKNLVNWIKEKYNVEIPLWTGSEIQLSLREQKRSTTFFILWVIFSYIFGIVGFILTLVAWYWLTIDYYVHEQAEIHFFNQVKKALKEKDISFDAGTSKPLPTRNMALYIILMIVPGVNLIWAVWWSYVLFKDPNTHFEAHEWWESQLEKIIAAGSLQKDSASDSPIEILKKRYARGEITREQFQQMKEDLEK